VKYALVVLLVCSGCGMPLGLNFQRSSLRAGGDWSTTISLEYEKAEFVEKQKADIKKYASELIDFLQTGQVAALPIAELEKLLKSKVPQEFYLVVDAALGYVESQQINVSAGIGKDNVKRIIAYLRGAINGAEKYDLKDRE